MKHKYLINMQPGVSSETSTGIRVLRKSIGFDKATWVLLILALISSSVNIAQNIGSVFKLVSPTTPRDLSRPSQFIGLDELTFDSNAEKDLEIVTFPPLLQQIDQQRPDYVSSDDPRRRFTHFGTISPEDRQLLITNSVSYFSFLY